MTKGRPRGTWFLVGVLVVLANGCATAPVTVPQFLVDARAALELAEEFNAPRLAPDAYQEAKRLVAKAEAAFAGEHNLRAVERMAFEARGTAQIAEARARRATAQSEYLKVRQALTTQRAVLGALAKQHEDLKTALARLRIASRPASEADTPRAAADRPAAALEESGELRAQPPLEKEREVLQAARNIPGAEALRESRGLVIILPGEILFEAGRSRLRPKGTNVLDRVAGLLVKYRKPHVRIEGHTDDSGEVLLDNMLSQARAESVLTYLRQAGVALERMQAIGLGATHTPASDDGVETHRRDERVEIVLRRSEAAGGRP